MSVAGGLGWLMVLTGVLLAGIVTPQAGAALTDDQRQTLLDEARAAYDKGISTLPTDPAAARASFRLAATRFGQLVDDGVSNGPLRYNLANAQLQGGNLGQAILNYRAALVHAPGDPLVLHNLEHARSLGRSRIAASGERALRGALFGWHDRTRLETRFTIFAIAWCVFWVLLIAKLFRRLPGAGWAAAACAVLWVATGASVAADVFGAPVTIGVVLHDDVVARKGNGEGFEPQFEEPLHEGVEFIVRDERPGWLEIELANGTVGWIPREDAGLVQDGRAPGRPV